MHAILSLLLLATTSSHAAEPRLPANALPVPLVVQATSYSCGAAALLATLYYWNAYTGNESSLYPLLNTTPQDGTEPDKMAAFAKTLGLEVVMRDQMTLADLRAGLARGETIILDLQAWRDEKHPRAPWKDTWDDGHYAVLNALDDEYAYFMDPSAVAGYAYVPIPELLERWHDYENRGGVVKRYLSLGISIRGKQPLKTIPATLVRME